MVVQANTPLGHRGEPWFEDGNIVLLVVDTDSDTTVAFKVHRGVLARHSEIFQSMFEIPSPTLENVEMADGCQVVRMHDRPTELSALIRALYDGASFLHRGIEDFYNVAGILRLATKYFVAHLRREAIKYLLEIWPHTIQGHDRFIERAVRAPLVGDLTYPYVHPLHVLNLARETHVNIILPSVLYFLSLYDLADLLRADHPKLLVKHPSQPSSQMSPRDVKDYTLMYQHRLQIVLDFIRKGCSGREPANTCQSTTGRCQKGFIRLGTRLSQSWVPRIGPLHYMVQAVDHLGEDQDICAQCRRSFKHDTLRLRDKLWAGLPAVLGLPSWEELEKSDMAT
ncbi:uncharacterized protein BXZ73DRAFT_51163 [Epithele typhae]|uniref:uncharacterized protein n=1 Tax=Epithele typhae TaxID=378194 RepID=UPI002008086C|nr:uncharacterized protein BXZ73DRAFT_51163 [Epithele typhae]KAH9922851.1 hypothetical protein BXZ73DRAFT_51163 [Epithele typhae]